MTDKLTEEEVHFLREFIRRSRENDAKLAVVKWNIFEKIATVGLLSALGWIFKIIIDVLQRK